ncbi:MAG: AAA family ATPase [Betaproteobacteria bacterium]
MPDLKFTPSQIVAALDQYVIGQTEAKRTVAVAVYAHFRKIAVAGSDGAPIAKSNVLLIGPSGTGKTLLCETLSRILDVPFATAEATSLAQTRFVNDEIDALLARLIDKAGSDLARAQRGIVFIDALDKLRAREGETRATSGENVQHALLKIMEGAQVKLASGQYLDTTQVLFVCGGAFVGLEAIMANNHGFGFVNTSDASEEDGKILERLNARVKPTDLFAYGLIPEFTGRLPVVARFHELTRELLVRIMIEPRNALYRQFRAILKNEGVDLTIERAAFEQIAQLALEYKTGARSLRGIFEEMLTPVLYAVPDDRAIRKVTIRSLFAAPELVRG